MHCRNLHVIIIIIECVTIAAGILANAEGLAILTVVKIGFLVTARGGSGIVIAKLTDGSKCSVTVVHAHIDIISI